MFMRNDQHKKRGGLKPGRKMDRFRFTSQTGVSLVTAVLVTSLLSTIMVVTISLVVSNNRMSVSHITSSKAIWLAEAGLEKALYWLRNQRSEERRGGKECRSRWSPYH